MAAKLWPTLYPINKRSYLLIKLKTHCDRLRQIWHCIIGSEWLSTYVMANKCFKVIWLKFYSVYRDIILQLYVQNS